VESGNFRRPFVMVKKSELFNVALAFAMVMAPNFFNPPPPMHLGDLILANSLCNIAYYFFLLLASLTSRTCDPTISHIFEPEQYSVWPSHPFNRQSRNHAE
jgi:hypothetical protein